MERPQAMKDRHHNSRKKIRRYGTKVSKFTARYYFMPGSQDLRFEQRFESLHLTHQLSLFGRSLDQEKKALF